MDAITLSHLHSSAPSPTSLVLHLPPVVRLSDDQLYDLCRVNPELRIERNAEGELIIMAPTGGETGRSNFRLIRQLAVWEERDGTGVGFDSSTGFVLPNGAMRSPDLAWVTRARLATLSAQQKKRFLPLCPDFVLELRSPSDNLETLQAKMVEYVENGADLGWLIDPEAKRVYVYRPGEPVECQEAPAFLSGDPVLPGFGLDAREIWQPDL